MKNINIEKWEISKSMIKYFTPYAMKVIMDRSLPDVRDGLKPVHRRILWKMYQMNMLSERERVKCLSIVGEVLKIHGHGDASVYEALAKLTEQNESQIYPYIDGEGAFGKQYCTDKPSASRYTFARLNSFTENEMLGNIKKGVVKMVGEDKDHMQPLILPVTYPNILVKHNEGIAVGMSCYFPSFNMVEVCNGTIEYIKNPNADLTKYIKAPDFSTGGQILYNENEMRNIIETGRGKLTVRSKYRYDSKSNCIEIYEIPHNTTANAIVDQITEMMKDGVKEIKDVSDIRDETGFNKEIEREELKITIDVKRSTDIEKLMNFLFRKTSLEKSFTTNLNCLVDYRPQLLGVKEIIANWLKFRRECIVSAVTHDVESKESELHLLKGLEKVLLDIDKAIEIIRFTKKSEVLEKLSNYFGIDEIQAKAVTKIELGNINEEYIIKQIKDIHQLDAEVTHLKQYVTNPDEINKDISKQLKKIAEKYGKPRKTEILYDATQTATTEEIDNYNVMFCLTKGGYFKKIPLVSLRGGTEHKLKENDTIIRSISGENANDVLIFTNKGNIYRIKPHKVADMKTATLGLYLPEELKFGKDEKIADMIATAYTEPEVALIFYKSGFVAKVSMSAYKSNYSILKGNINDDILCIEKIINDYDVMLLSTEGKCLVFNTSEINAVSSRSAKGVRGIKLHDGEELIKVITEPTDNIDLKLMVEKNGIVTEVDVNTDKLSYYKTSRGNAGYFTYNCRAKREKIVEII